MAAPDVSGSPLSWIQENVAALVYLLLSCLLLTGGCTQQTKTEAGRDRSVASGKDQKGYLHSDGDSVMFLQWTEVNSKLNGQMSVFYAKGNRGKSTETSSHSFEGLSDGKNISLNFTGSQWTDGLGGKTWTGTISGSELTLVIPVWSGILSPVKFSPGTVEQYNQIVLGITQGVQTQNARTQQENAEATRIEAEKNAGAEGNNRVRYSINALTSSTNQLESSLKFDDIFESYSRTWEKMKADHKELLEEAADKPFTAHKLGRVQHHLSVLQSDIQSFESHSQTFDYRIARVKDVTNSVRDAQKNLKESWEILQQAVAANSSGTPNGQFSEGQISQPLRLGEEKIQKASEEFQQASKKRDAYESQAKDLYRKAESFVKSLKAVE